MGDILKGMTTRALCDGETIRTYNLIRKHHDALSLTNLHMLLCGEDTPCPSQARLSNMYVMWRKRSQDTQAHHRAHAKVQLHRSDRPQSTS
jgi:hypothetical protein